MNFLSLIRNYKKLVEIRLRHLKEKNYRKRIRKHLKNTDFSIIANNCWGGGVYETFGLPYTTPTVGLFFYAACYIKFLLNLKENLHADLIFIKESKYNEANNLRKNKYYPIGLINGEIEIHFLHYASEHEALEKWKRRSQRVNFDNLYLALTDNDLCTIKEIEAFDKLAYKKVFFSAQQIPHIQSLVWLPQFQEKGKVGDLYSDPWLYRKYFNVVKWLNN